MRIELMSLGMLFVAAPAFAQSAQAPGSVLALCADPDLPASAADIARIARIMHESSQGVVKSILPGAWKSEGPTRCEVDAKGMNADALLVVAWMKTPTGCWLQLEVRDPRTRAVRSSQTFGSKCDVRGLEWAARTLIAEHVARARKEGKTTALLGKNARSAAGKADSALPRSPTIAPMSSSGGGNGATSDQKSETAAPIVPSPPPPRSTASRAEAKVAAREEAEVVGAEGAKEKPAPGSRVDKAAPPPEPSRSDPSEPPTSEARMRKKSVVSFDGDTVDSAVAKPEGAYVLSRKKTDHGEVLETRDGKVTIEDDGGRGARSAPPPRTESPRVEAGASDDNQQYNAFLRFLSSNQGRRALEHDISGRKIITVRDQKGRAVPDALVRITDGTVPLVERRTYADGRALIFPSELRRASHGDLRLRVESGSAHFEGLFAATQDHQINVELDLLRSEVGEVPLDVAFVLDTTGSMGDEIERLRKTLEVIHFQLTHLSPPPSVRFGMVLYRDRGDDYVTRVIPFTKDVLAFRASLYDVEAGGGGDDPEDVQAALKDAMLALDWRKSGVKLAFLIGDAPPHLDYGETYTYVSAMQDAAKKGIKITAIGCSGLPLEGEIVWRQLAQYTLAPYVFLTRGEKGNAEGSPSSVSHHVGSNWVADTLDAIVVRMAKVEVGHYSGAGAPTGEDYFLASARKDLEAKTVLEDLFQQSVKQLGDYSVERIDDRTPTVMLPVAPKQKALLPVASKLQNRLAFALSRAHMFQLLEEQNRARILQTAAEQFALAYDSSKMIEIGKLVPARLAILSEIDRSHQGQLEMLVKLVRLETGEVLSLSLLKIEEALLL
jgi:hypothetical protein